MPSGPRVEDLLRYERIRELDAHPTERRIAYTVENADEANDSYQSAIWIVDADGGSPRRMTAGLSRDNSPKWSPDGKTIAFLSNRAGGIQVYLLPAEGGEATQVGNFQQGVVDITWSPDGGSLAVIAVLPNAPVSLSGDNAPATTGQIEIVSRLPYKLDGMGYTLGEVTHLFVMDAATGNARQLTSGPFEVRAAEWSPDGRQIYIGRTREGRLAHRTDIWSIDVSTKEARQITQDIGMAQTPKCAPQCAQEGQYVVFTGSRHEGDAQVRLWLYDVASEEVRCVGGDALEVVDGQSISWDRDGRGVLLLAARRGIQEVAHIALEDGAYDTVAAADGHISGFKRLHDDAVAAFAESVSKLNQLYLYERESAPRALTALNAWWRDRRAPRVAYRQFSVPDGDGGMEAVDGWVIRPPGDDRPGPLLIDVHGGPASYVLLSYASHPYWQSLADAGWTILALNAVGSSSYGREFSNRLRERWGELDLPQHLAAASTLEEEGVCDGRRAIAGKSYGGYASAWAVTHARCFRAAVVMAPVADIEAHYGSSDSGYYADEYEMVGRPLEGADDENREPYSRASPRRYTSHVVTPTLMLHGKDDQRCPVTQSEDFFVRVMTTSEAPAELVLYPGESHHFLETGKPSVRVDVGKRIVQWLTHWIERELPTRS
ncbi:S9 family peptidase [Cupriavidus plantarum]|uniref:S9 family peptidase n=1 Tax=Cupriavidus plantarum TaxID=942865 RepID=UPI001B09C89D|nr:S9 family peptidase [Cupriavidus plantarum]CAG2136791.1 Dipeptidyl-peptidase 5 [Cupriavidus plantarum]SMR84798.1 Dipeptidyl aminopeptidase/acylaminoacyl peptidase [Cupriavidus plantarum]